MTPINEVSVGKFCKFKGDVSYVVKNNFKDSYMLAPITGRISSSKWGVKVYVYKRPHTEWITQAKEWVEVVFKENHMDNLTYIENLAILKSYGI
jgi:hypothetical protein